MLPVGQETRRGRVLGWGIPTAANLLLALLNKLN